MNKKFVITAIFAAALATNAQAVTAIDATTHHSAAANGNNPDLPNNDAGPNDANVAVYTPGDSNINYQDKKLDNYQDPYLTNPRAYKSNQYGQAPAAPAQNAFYVREGSSFNRQAARNSNAPTDNYVGTQDPTEYNQR